MANHHLDTSMLQYGSLSAIFIAWSILLVVTNFIVLVYFYTKFILYIVSASTSKLSWKHYKGLFFFFLQALKMVLEKENWQNIPPDTIQVISFAGLVGDGAALIISSDGNSASARAHQSNKSADSFETGAKKSGFSWWLKNGNPFLQKLTCTSKEWPNSPLANGSTSEEPDGKITENFHGDKFSPRYGVANGNNSVSEDENEDLLADFIDEDSQLPSRLSKPNLPRNHSSYWNDEESAGQTGSSLCLLR